MLKSIFLFHYDQLMGEMRKLFFNALYNHRHISYLKTRFLYNMNYVFSKWDNYVYQPIRFISIFRL